jgi:hypothetical protein
MARRVSHNDMLDGADFLREPEDEDTLRVAIAEMRSRGMTPRDIADSLGVHDNAVRRLLGERGGR